MLTAVLDTCVLWPSLQRDFLLSLAVESVYRPTWSSATLDELEFHEAAKLQRRGVAPAEARARASSLIGQMRVAFPEAEVTGWESSAGSFGLPDPDDEHVVAAAQLAGSSVIVTENGRDFPALLLPAGMRASTAREFALEAVALHPIGARVALREIAARSGRHGPALTELEIMTVLARRYGMTEAMTLLRKLWR